MPGKDGVAACREIMELVPCTRGVVLTASREQDAVIEALAAGAMGYLEKTTSRDRLLSTFRDVAAGELRVPAEAVSRVFAELRRDRPSDAAERAGLTEWELAILASFVRGMPYSDIAKERSVKPVTIRKAMHGVQAKIGVVPMREVVAWVVRNGVVPVRVPEP